ncbi:MAG: hypothetical protein P9L93_01090 [Candidatus Gorgyraea atricola]|nr:hypothetical protein [Candidatus Gorgyraea atricola]
MQKLKYKWDGDIWLLHVELKNTNGADMALYYSRIMQGKLEPENPVSVKPGQSHRFIISKKSPGEAGLDIEFNNKLCVEIFKLQDRAYLPSKADRCYFNGEVK